ncbi:LysE family transporter [uncultured Desulfobacter sp.]|uniref:LysE/ArgO family amino acid transporter n=1 Tax=uncultured Desulfobacter sp. TaxID=240139 RepID=UPI002AA83367|nr:LysE family transporter [uncultured Desulfobacter sp.]
MYALSDFQVIISTLAVTLLNPHFYLEASQFPHSQIFYFWAGSVTASTLWFISLTIGARVFSPIFKKPISWRILDAVIGLTLWTIAFSLTRYAMIL